LQHSIKKFKTKSKKNFMKKIILALVVLTTSVFVSNAQVQFGLKAGVNFSTLGGDDADFDGKKTNTGFNVAGLAVIPFGENFAFSPELQYSANQGLEYRESPAEYNLNLSYINIPLMLQYRNSGFVAEVGPQVGFLTAAKMKMKAGNLEDEEDVKDDVKSTDFAANIGLGYVLPAGIGIQARYSLGLGKIDKEDESEIKNRVFSINLVYIFGQKKGSAKK